MCQKIFQIILSDGTQFIYSCDFVKENYISWLAKWREDIKKIYNHDSIDQIQAFLNFIVEISAFIFECKDFKSRKRHKK